MDHQMVHVGQGKFPRAHVMPRSRARTLRLGDFVHGPLPGGENCVEVIGGGGDDEVHCGFQTDQLLLG